MMSMDQNGSVLGGHISFSPLLNKRVCRIPFSRLLAMLLMSLLLIPSLEEEVRTSGTHKRDM